MYNIGIMVMNREIREFCNYFVEKYPNFTKRQACLDCDLIEKLTKSILDYLGGDKLSNWNANIIDIKNLKKYNESDHKGIGLIIFNFQSELQIILSGGRKNRSYIKKIEQEISDRPRDTGRIFYKRLIDSEKEDATAYIQSCDCVVLTPHDNISSADIDVILHAIYTFKLIRYELKGSYTNIIAEYKKKKGWM